MNETRLTLKGLVFYGRHGALPEEQKLGQRFVVDVVVKLSAALDVSSDRLDDTLNYSDLFALIEATFTGKRYNLIEACAHDIAEAVLAGFKETEEVTVAVKKPSVPVDCVCDFFEACITRAR